MYGPEDADFLHACMDTPVMQYVHEYLQLSGHTQARDRDAFVSELRQLWFDMYKRKVKNDSSGFEHVFLGEIKVLMRPLRCESIILPLSFAKHPG